VSSGSGPVAGGARLPTYIPAQGAPPPDLPSPNEGVDHGYLSYPTQRFKSVAEKPGTGGEVTVQTWIQVAPPPPMDQNAYWQEVNKQLNATLRINIVPQGDYPAKLAVTMAGNDLPDILYIGNRTLTAGLPEFLRARCADLTPYLSGDAVRDYPNLANLPTSTWTAMAFSGAIYGVPVPINPFDWVLFVHQELIDQAGLKHPKNAEEFKAVLQALNKPQSNQWAINTESSTGFGVTSGLYPGMFGAPNQWRSDSTGKFTRSLETEEYKAAVAFARDLYAAGVVTPTALQLDNTAGKVEFHTRKSALRWDGFRSYGIFWEQGAQLQPKPVYRTISPFAHDGGKPTYYLSPGHRGFSVIKKGSVERVKEMLRILNWIASPFGSEEGHVRAYGLEGVHHTIDANGWPVLTDQGRTETTVPLGWMTQPAPTLSSTRFGPDYARLLQSDEIAYLPAGISDPTTALDSPTTNSKGPLVYQTWLDGMTAIVSGRRPFSDYDQLVKDWRTTGGDTIRSEYEKAYAASKA
jgi:putative aldouronate transport system substrate-binding protein